MFIYFRLPQYDFFKQEIEIAFIRKFQEISRNDFQKSVNLILKHILWTQWNDHYCSPNNAILENKWIKVTVQYTRQFIPLIPITYASHMKEEK